MLCWYAHPSADDFLTANDVHKHGHWGFVQHMYLNWTGRYSSLLAQSFLNPVSYGNDKAGYGLVCLLFLLLLLVCLVLLLRTLLLGAGLTARQLWQAGASLLLLFTYQLPSMAEGFYWLTSSFNYMLSAIVLLLALASLAMHVRTTHQGNSRYLTAVAVLLFLIPSFNESVALPLLVTVWGFTLLNAKRQHWAEWQVALAISMGCAVSFLAPGNTVRSLKILAIPPDRFALTLNDIKYTAYCLVSWVGSGVLVVVTLLLVPLFARLTQLPELPINRLTRQPIVLTVLLPAFLAIGMYPAFWISGEVLPLRAHNILYLCFILNWLLAAYAWVSYFVRKQTAPVTWSIPSFIYLPLLAWLPFTFLTDYNHHLSNPGYRLSTNNSLLAYRDLLHGNAAHYDAQLSARYRYLRQTPVLHAAVPPLLKPPFTILFSDITTDTANWANRAYAEFFGKKTIRVAPEPVGK
ncbi:DUF6056 family protein [Hymenobacter tibetensis]|uniref:DUF6056 family protein n=1 Tax=Hymenobacter tibetensis TaxID=497967 RepID=A0ABY4CZN3_9BACT|nr:DUF6056 family protein [Hymenobacter tibetensis]UOG75024.1 DUF6056 family protein [Hymenobacter tibetensis]